MTQFLLVVVWIIGANGPIQESHKEFSTKTQCNMTMTDTAAEKSRLSGIQYVSATCHPIEE